MATWSGLLPRGSIKFESVLQNRANNVLFQVESCKRTKKEGINRDRHTCLVKQEKWLVSKDRYRKRLKM